MYSDLDRAVDRVLIREIFDEHVVPQLVGRQRQVFNLILTEEDSRVAANSLELSLAEFGQKKLYVLWKCRSLLADRFREFFNSEDQ
ncbi:MAG: hypothetical protein KDA72_12900 [Planctomycetales bacterium]|nr:hypothetical protein [Planctomycetales bacterium]